MCGANMYRHSFSVLILCMFELVILIHARNMALMKRTDDNSFPDSVMDDEIQSHMKDVDLNSPGRYKIQKRHVQYTNDNSSHINDPKKANSDTISSDRKQTHRNDTNARHSNEAPLSSKKFESGFQSDGTTDHTSATGDKQNRHGTVHRHRHSKHSFRPLSDSFAIATSDAAEQHTSRNEARYQSEDPEHFDTSTDSNSNIHPDQISPSKHANIKVASSQSYRQGFETFIQNLDVKNSKGLYPFNLKDAADRHIPRLDEIPKYMQHIYLLLSKKDNKEPIGGQMPTIRAVKLSPNNSSQIPGISFHLTGLITHENISRVDLVFETPGCENLPSHVEIVIQVNPGFGQDGAPYQERLLVSQYLSFYKADMSVFFSNLINDNITLVLRQVGEIDKLCLQHPLLVTYKDFDMIQTRQQRSTNSGADTTNSSENIEQERVLFLEIMTNKLYKQQEPNPSACRRMNWFIDMRIFDFSWYVGPNYIDAHFCSGNCSYPMADAYLNATNYSFIKTLYHEITNYNTISILPRATCVPISYLPQSIIYIDKANTYTATKLSNMKLMDCGCR